MLCAFEDEARGAVLAFAFALGSDFGAARFPMAGKEVDR